MRWNSVEHKLPPEDYAVLIVDDMEEMYVGWLKDGKWNVCDCCKCIIENVMFWRDVPHLPYD